MVMMRTLSKTFRYLGILLLGLGALVTASAVYTITSTRVCVKKARVLSRLRYVGTFPNWRCSDGGRTTKIRS